MDSNQRGVSGTSVKNVRRGQALMEYILLTACLSVLSIGFAKFISQKIFSGPLEDGKLPTKAAICISHRKSDVSKCQ